MQRHTNAADRAYLLPMRCSSFSRSGDTDTVAAMAGGLAGALHGTAWLPAMWWNQLENGVGSGRDELMRLGALLGAMDVRD
jgi:hypothetical protein